MAEFVQPGMVRLRVVDPTQHWLGSSHGAQQYEDQTDADVRYATLTATHAGEQTTKCRNT
jgi:hypothetical protein